MVLLNYVGFFSTLQYKPPQSSYWSQMGGKLSGTYIASFIHPTTLIHLSDMMLTNMITNASGTTQGLVSCPRTGGGRDQPIHLPIVR